MESCAKPNNAVKRNPINRKVVFIPSRIAKRVPESGVETP
jgi:hypothetical protein